MKVKGGMEPVGIEGGPCRAWAHSRPCQEQHSAVQRCVQMADGRQSGDQLQCVSVPESQTASCCPPEKPARELPLVKKLTPHYERTFRCL